MRTLLTLLMLAGVAFSGCADDSDLQSIDGGSTTPRPWSPEPGMGAGNQTSNSTTGTGTGNGTASATTTSTYPR